MVGVRAVRDAQVQRHACVEGERTEKLFRKAEIVAADPFLRKLRLKDEERAAADV